MELNNIISTIKNAKSVGIMPHISVDGDGLGSSLALGLALIKLGKPVVIYLEEEIPSLFRFLPGLELVRNYDGNAPEHDVVVALDCGDRERLGQRAQVFDRAYTTLNIDHHATNTKFAYYNYVQTDASATGEIVYEIIQKLGVLLDTGIASCLYVAIASDTGGFRYSNTTAVTHQIAADLLKNGVLVADISQRIFETSSYERVKLSGQAISSLQVLEDGRVALMVLTDEMLRNSGAKDEDANGIVNIGRNIQGVEVSVVLRVKKEGLIKGNLRSKTYVDVSAIAELFGGGGHKRAAGFMKDGSLHDIQKQLLQDIKAAL